MTTIDVSNIIPLADQPVIQAGLADNIAGIRTSDEKVVLFPVDSLPVNTQVQADIDALKAGQTSGSFGAATLADAQALMPKPSGTLFVVTNDPTPANNGTWRSDGTDLVQSADRVSALEQEIPAKAGRYPLALAAESATDALVGVSVTDTTVVQVAQNSTNAPVSNRVAYAAAEALNGAWVNTFRFYVQDVPTLGDLTLTLYKRVQGITGGVGGLPPSPTSGEDTLLATVTVNGVDLTDQMGWQEIEFRLPEAITTTGSDLLVWKLEVSGNLSIGIKNDATSSTQFRRGWFQNAGGGSQNIGTPNQLAWEALLHEVTPAQAKDVATLQTQATAVTRSFEPSMQISSSRTDDGNLYAQSAGHYAWTFGIQAGSGQDVAAGVPVDMIAIETELASTVDHVRLRVWKRPTDAGTYSTYPGAGANDVLLSNQTLTVSDLGLIAASGFWQSLEFPFPMLTTEDGYTYLFELWAFDASSANVGIGITRTAPGTLNQQQRGWFRGGSAISSGTALSWRLGGAGYDDVLDDGHLFDRFKPTFAVSGLSITVGGYAYKAGARTGIAQSLAIIAAASGTETVNNYSLIYSTATQFTSIPGAWVGRRHISAVSAVKSSDSTALVLNTDFAYHVNGKLRGLANVAAYNVNATYAYARERYDLIQIDPRTLAMSVVQGTERDYDAIEYRPAASEGCIVIGYVHVIGGSARIVPAGEFEGGVVRRGSESDWQFLRQHNRRSLARTLGKIARGAAITVAAYGDSIVAIQTGATPPYTANGNARDRPENFLINFPSDTVAALPKYDFGDGAGQVHIKISAPWYLVAAIEAITGQPVTYLNFGIGGTTSASTTGNGLDPDRLQPVLDSGADLLLLHFGMNELGSTATLANIKSIAAQAQAVGMDVVVMSPTRRNIVDGTVLASWNYTTATLWRAAVESSSGFAPQHWIGSDANLGGLGASSDSCAASNLINHPGPTEFSRYGAVLVEAVLG